MTHQYTLYLGDSDMILLLDIMEEKIHQLKYEVLIKRNKNLEHKLRETHLLYSLFQNGETEIASYNTMLGGALPKLAELPNWEKWLKIKSEEENKD
jgi:hypothetical protein